MTKPRLWAGEDFGEIGLVEMLTTVYRKVEEYELGVGEHY